MAGGDAFVILDWVAELYTAEIVPNSSQRITRQEIMTTGAILPRLRVRATKSGMSVNRSVAPRVGVIRGFHDGTPVTGVTIDAY
jgi:hypothetical protein